MGSKPQSADSKPRRGNPNWRAGGPSPNPAGRRRASDAERIDGWANILTGYGTARDKRRGAAVDVEVLTHVEQRRLWRADDMAARAIETVPNEMFREGFEVKIADKDLLAHVQREAKRLRVRARFKLASKYERAYGGAAIFPIINDGAGDFSRPLNAQQITRIRHLRVLEPRELIVDTLDDDINSESYGEPLLYRYMPAGGRAAGSMIKIHRSRLIIFPGKRVTNDTQETAPQQGWGDSILLPMHEVLRDFQIGWGTASVLLVDFAQGVYQMDGLAELIQAKQDGVVLKRLQTMDVAKSVIKAIVIDGKDKYERQQTPITGLAEVLDRLASRLAAAARLSVTLLMGQSPKGLGNEGDSDISFLYDQISSEHDDKLPLLEQMYRLIFAQGDGPTKGKEPESWSIEFCSLWQPTEKEAAETRRIVAETDKVEIEAGVVTADEVRRARHGGDTYSTDLRVDVEEDKKLEVARAREEAMAGDLRSTMGGAPAGDTKVADTAMTGPQITSLLEVVMAFNRGEISAKTAKAIIVRGFRVSPAEADVMIDEQFEPEIEEPEPPPALDPTAAAAGGEEPEPEEPDPEEPARDATTGA